MRPILDVVLSRLAELGEVTVRARKTFVALVARRTFARIMPTTRSRVDVSLRLPNARPGGRLPAATTRAEETVRIPLTAPEEVDAEVVGWLRDAYRANA